MKRPPPPFPLKDLPNLGTRAVSLLVAAGIKTPKTLRRLGPVAAALRIRRIRPNKPPSRRMLIGLEGAIRGVRWRSIPKAEGDQFWKRYQRRIRSRLQH